MSNHTSDGKIIQLSPPSPEEHNRRIVAEATRLAGLTPGEWRLWYKSSAERLGITPEELAELVKAQIVDREQKAREKRDEEKRAEDRADRERKAAAQQWREKGRSEDAAAKKAKLKADTFADTIKLPADQQDGKIEELAKTLGEDAAALAAEFAEYRQAETETTKGSAEWDVEPWPEPIATAAVLEELINRIATHIVAKAHEILGIALWVMMAWVHEVAAQYSVYLVATGPKDDCGKTKLIVEVVGRLVPRPYLSGDPTAASIFRSIDRDKPTLLIDDADTLFRSKPELAQIFKNAWTRGIKIPRTEWIGGERRTVWFDIFGPKTWSMIGTELPRPLLGRCLLVGLWPKMAGEGGADVNPHDQALLGAFHALCRMLARWSQDNAEALKNATPVFPEGFTNRPADNAKLLLAIAELAGGEWAEMARTALERLLREEREPSWLERLLQELWKVFVVERRRYITSEELVNKRLTADPTSEWCDYNGHHITQREVAALLRKLIRPTLVGPQRLGGYFCGDFLDKEIFERFLGRDPLILSEPKPTAKKAMKKPKPTAKKGKPRRRTSGTRG